MKDEGGRMKGVSKPNKSFSFVIFHLSFAMSHCLGHVSLSVKTN